MRRLSRFTAVLALLIALTGHAHADSTSVDLYRWGHATSPQLANIRPYELGTFQRNGQMWVEHDSGGISMYSTQTPGKKNVWRLPRGSSHSSRLRIVNDKGDHWLIEPAVDMPLEEFKSLLRSLEQGFQKVS